jgi:hypothetical protein
MPNMKLTVGSPKRKPWLKIREEDTEQKAHEADNWQHCQTSFDDLKAQPADEDQSSLEVLR